MDKIKIIRARQHNLKNISLEIPKDKLVVITGLSGSGKSSLAFDTIYAEGQRRYVESLSAYARQFLELMEKPDVDHIEGLSPAIAIEQKAPSKNPRSTVATVTEIYDYFRLLFARIGKRYCPQCGQLIQSWAIQNIVLDILKKFNGKVIYMLSPLVQGRTGTYQELFAKLKKQGFDKVRVNNKIYELSKIPPLSRYKKHTIELVVDYLKVTKDEKERITDSAEMAANTSQGLINAMQDTQKNPLSVTYNEKYSCTKCAIGFSPTEPRLFSFNSPYGACKACAGLGIKMLIAEDLVVPNPNLSIKEGALIAWSNPITTKTHRWKTSWSGYYFDALKDVCKRQKIPIDKPWKTLSSKQKDILLHGGGATYKSTSSGNECDFEGVITNLHRRLNETESEYVKETITKRFVREITCRECEGKRLKPEALAVKIADKNISDIAQMQITQAKEFIDGLKLTEKETVIGKQILKEIKTRLGFLINVGLNYLTLDRRSQTLSGGESQRIHLATQIGSGLTGVLYVLDEPTIGLHPRDNLRLLTTLKSLRDIGNTLIVVEHDRDTINASDWVIDLGPGAGEYGGKIVAQGVLKDVLKNPSSLTAQYLNGTKNIEIREELRKPKKDKSIKIKKASQFNLKNIDVEIPLGLFTCVTGVSGSGKSTLVHEVLYKTLAQKLYRSKETPGKCAEIKGIENIDKVIIVDQSPIGRTPRSNPATYTGVFTYIRELFAKLPESKRRGYQPGRFSFNVKGGRCGTCKGDGIIKIQMQFLPDVYVHCQDCKGKRFNEDTLQVHYNGKSISDILETSVTDCLKLFENIPQIKNTLKTLDEVGLGYIRLGQSATTLSGGEAQRVKLSSELRKKATGKTLYILDEPTTGLHFADVEKLLNTLHKITDSGNTVLVIEHNMDVIKTADWIIDLGPFGGDMGGRVIGSTDPNTLSKNPKSFTGKYLKEVLKR
ncbi:MAG TPA: excinuclease ABC subunit UvrA [Elusimicrobiales bacterium]|nr:excinuclease ABC subunit UvrA [Elusimicrobiales bacterium]